jgi:hypothetical protein
MREGATSPDTGRAIAAAWSTTIAGIAITTAGTAIATTTMIATTRND